MIDADVLVQARNAKEVEAGYCMHKEEQDVDITEGEVHPTIPLDAEGWAIDGNGVDGEADKDGPGQAAIPDSQFAFAGPLFVGEVFTHGGVDIGDALEIL